MSRISSIPKLTKNIRVKNGTCPNGHSLMTDERKFKGENAIVAAVSIGGHKGTIYLNPFYGEFEFECDIPTQMGDVVDMFCRECGVSLSVETICRMCNLPMSSVHLPDGGEVEVCPRVGCHNHALKIINLDEQLARMYVDETKVQM